MVEKRKSRVFFRYAEKKGKKGEAPKFLYLVGGTMAEPIYKQEINNTSGD